MAINVDECCPVTDGLLRVAHDRANAILKEWARLHSIWGTGGTHGRDGEIVEHGPTLRHLALACYVQGVRDTAAVAAHRIGGQQP